MIRNERLSATILNGLEIALFTVGLLAPVFSVVQGQNVASIPMLAMTATCSGIAFGRHFPGRRLSKGATQ